MNWQFSIYPIAPLIAVIIAFSLFIISWRDRREQAGATFFALMNLGIGWWSFAHAVQLSQTTLETKIFWANLQYLGVGIVVTCWLLFSVEYTGRTQWLNRRLFALLFIQPLIVQLLLWTDAGHHLMRQDAILISLGGIFRLKSTFGLGFWLHTLYSYTLLLIGAVLFLQFVRQSQHLYKRQVAAILAGIAMPWLGNIVYLTGISPVDLTAISFVVSSIFFAWGVFRFQLFDVTPMAHLAIIESLQSAVIVLDQHDRIVEINPEGETLFSVSAEEAVGRLVTAVVSAPIFSTHHSETNTQAEIQLDKPDGPQYLEVQINTLKNWRDQTNGRVFLLRNVTDYRQIEQAEREQRLFAEALNETTALLNRKLELDDLLESILINMDRVLPHDAANIMLVEEGVAHVVRQRGYEKYGVNDRIQQIRAKVSDVATLMAMVETGSWYIIPDVNAFADWVRYPHLFWVNSYLGAPIYMDGEIIGFINLDNSEPESFSTDQGKRLLAFANQAAIALSNARIFAALADQNEELDAYARTIAHDLKSPLTVMRGYLDLLKQTESLSSQGGAFLEKAQQTTLGMSEMISQLLRLAQLREVTSTATHVNAANVVAVILDRLEPLIQERGATVTIAKRMEPVLAHEPWLEEIFANLVSNAIKYIGNDNPDPQVILTCESQDRMVRFSIRDNGVGIQKKDLDQLFVMFARFHQNEAEGTGLGLSIVQRMVHKMGGEIGVDSIYGEGSVFWFRLPAA